MIAETLRVVHSPKAAAAIEQTSDANQALIAMEERSFVLAQHGKADGRERAAGSSEYARQKAIYAQGFNSAATVFRGEVTRSTERVRRYRPLSLAIGIVGGAILLLAGMLFLRLARERERMADENARRTRGEVDRRAEEVAYFETQQHFSEILQVTRREPEAHRLIKRHLERRIPGSAVAILNRNNSDNRLEVMTELPADAPCWAPRSAPNRTRARRSDSVALHKRDADDAPAAGVRHLRQVARRVAVHAVARGRRGDRRGARRTPRGPRGHR